MDTLEQLKDKLIKAQAIQNPSLAVTIAIHNLQKMIEEREKKAKQNGRNSR